MFKARLKDRKTSVKQESQQLPTTDGFSLPHRKPAASSKSDQSQQTQKGHGLHLLCNPFVAPDLTLSGYKSAQGTRLPYHFSYQESKEGGFLKTF